MRWRCGLWWLCAIGPSAWGQTGPATPAAPTPPPPAGGGLRWQVPPIHVAGTLGYELRLDHAEAAARRRQQLVTATFNAASYLYQPWFATVTGTLALTASHAVSRSALESAPPAGGGDSDRFITGGLRLALFPRSRFPLEARYEVADSRTDTALGGGVDYRASTFALSQRYRPARGDFSIAASLERRTQEGAGIGRDVQQTALADFSTRWARHQLAASLSRSQAERRGTGEETDFWSVVARHSYSPGAELSVESAVNWARSDEQLLASGAAQRTLSQWSSVAMWRPERLPLTVSASARGFNLATSDAALSSESLAAGVGVSWEPLPQLRLSANATATHLNGQTQTALVGSLGATYQGPSRRLGDWQHDWFGGATLSSARNAGFAERSVSTQLGQTLLRQWPRAEGGSLAISLGQTLGVTVSNGVGLVPQATGRDGHDLSRALSHNAALTWSATGAQRSAYARLSLADARQLDGEQSRFTLLHAQLSGSWELDRERGWSGDLTVQRVFQRALPLPGEPVVDVFGFNRQITTSASGEFAWRQLRVFGVPRLRFTSRVRLAHDAQWQTRALVALPDRETGSWENRLDWQVGRLDTSLALRLARQDGAWREFLQWRVLRAFGD